MNILEEFWYGNVLTLKLHKVKCFRNMIDKNMYQYVLLDQMFDNIKRGRSDSLLLVIKHM